MITGRSDLPKPQRWNEVPQSLPEVNFFKSTVSKCILRIVILVDLKLPNFKLTEPTLDERTAGGKPTPCLSATHSLQP